MNARPYPQKKDVDNIGLNASLHPLQNRNFTSVFDVQCPFRAKGLRRANQNRNFTSVFDVQRPFRAKGLRRANQHRNFTSVFDAHCHFVRNGCDAWIPHDTSKSQFYFSFWRPTSISCERVAMDTSKSQFYLCFQIEDNSFVFSHNSFHVKTIHMRSPNMSSHMIELLFDVLWSWQTCDILFSYIILNWNGLLQNLTLNKISFVYGGHWACLAKEEP